LTTAEYVHKSEKLADLGREAGWTTKIVPDIGDEITWNIFFVRKPEAMKVVYVGNRLVESTYICGEKMTSPPHKAAVVKILLGQPDLKKVGSDEVIKSRTLPFDPATTDAKTILTTLFGRKITWLNSMTTELESERIDTARNQNSRYYRIMRTQDDRRYVEFISHNAFRAVYLDAIVAVH
jgi:hypothetical protein